MTSVYQNDYIYAIPISDINFSSTSFQVPRYMVFWMFDGYAQILFVAGDISEFRIEENEVPSPPPAINMNGLRNVPILENSDHSTFQALMDPYGADFDGDIISVSASMLQNYTTYFDGDVSSTIPSYAQDDTSITHAVAGKR